MLAHEYGWTHRYVLEQCSKKEVFAFVDAIGARYARQHDEYEKAKDGRSKGKVSKMSEREMLEAGFKINE